MKTGILSRRNRLCNDLEAKNIKVALRTKINGGEYVLYCGYGKKELKLESRQDLVYAEPCKYKKTSTL